MAGLAVAVLVFVLPAFADTPEFGSDPSVTLTVTPDDFVGNGQTVLVTGAGFPANTPGVIRQCGGPPAAPQCDADIAATFVTTATGDIPPTPVTAERIVDTGTTTFNCGVQQCFLVASAGGRTSQHHLSIAGAGTLVPTSTSSSTTTTTTSPSTTTTTTIPATVPIPGANLVCPLLQSFLGSFPFLSGLIGGLLAVFGCGAVG